MRYPLIAFFFIFVLPPFTAHALLAGSAQIAKIATGSAASSRTLPASISTSHNWTVTLPGR